MASSPIRTTPIDPGPPQWTLPDPAEAPDDDELIAVGADLAPATLLAAYRHGLFPMPVGGNGRRRGADEIGWWSPNPRAVIPLDGLHVSRTTRRAARTFTVTHDQRFTEVMIRCGDPRRPHGWITRPFVEAYSTLHRMGWANSVEVWRGDDLVGGVYGVRIDGLFAGESMFHRATDASKVALGALVERLRDDGATLFDVQWATDHLRTLGAVEMPRREYLARLAAAAPDPTRAARPAEATPPTAHDSTRSRR